MGTLNQLSHPVESHIKTVCPQFIFSYTDNKITIFINRPMDLVVQSTSSEGGTVISFLHIHRIVSTIFEILKFHLHCSQDQISSVS